MSFEETLKRSHADLVKLDQQIEHMISSLLLEDDLEEAGLISLLDSKVNKFAVPLPRPFSSSSLLQSSSSKKGGGLSTKKLKRTHTGEEGLSSNKLSLVSNSSELSSSFKVPNTPLSKTSKPQQPKVDVTTAFKLATTSFTCEETETFLIPILDKWVFGSTFVNSSNTTQKLPYLILTLVNGIGNVSQTFTNGFVYNFKSIKLTVDKDFNFLENRDTLPVQETLASSIGRGEETNDKILPGSKFLITACFSHPTFTPDEDVSIVISMCSEDSNFVWSRKINISSRMAVTCYTDHIFEKFQPEILLALSKYCESFRLEHLPSSISTSSLINFMETELALSEIRTISSRFDTTTSLYGTKQQTVLWGSLFQVDICTRNTSSLRCSIHSRSYEQLRHYNNLLTQWLIEEKEHNPDSELRMSNMLSKTKRRETIQQAIEKEVQTLIHLIFLDYRKMFLRDDQSQFDDVMEVDDPKQEDNDEEEEGSSSMNEIFSRQSKTRVAVKWLKTYLRDMSTLDRIFMR